MIQEIKTLEDVKMYFKKLHAEDLNFHPDNDFFDYIKYQTKEPTYSEAEAAVRNQLLIQAFEVCEEDAVDIYALCIDIFMPNFHSAFPSEE